MELEKEERQKPSAPLVKPVAPSIIKAPSNHLERKTKGFRLSSTARTTIKSCKKKNILVFDYI
jgi:hypothetical protein